MYDGPNNTWLLRETGIQIGIPELWGNVFIGRQKVGISLNKITVGYAGWTMERMPMNDATIPILTDGIKWLGVHPSKRANWNVGLLHQHPARQEPVDRLVRPARSSARFAVLPHPRGRATAPSCTWPSAITGASSRMARRSCAPARSPRPRPTSSTPGPSPRARTTSFGLRGLPAARRRGSSARSTS